MELLKTAQKLPDYAVIKLTREGNNYSELIEEARTNPKGNEPSSESAQ